MRIRYWSSDVCSSDLMERAQRRVLIQYPKRQTRQGIMQADRSHLPLKVNTAGVIPPISASSLLLMPLTISQFAGNRVAGERARSEESRVGKEYVRTCRSWWTA